MDYEVNKLADELEQELNPNVMSEQELQGIVGKEIDDAIDFIDNHISPIRQLRNITEASRLATKKTGAAKSYQWTCVIPCRR